MVTALASCPHRVRAVSVWVWTWVTETAENRIGRRSTIIEQLTTEDTEAPTTVPTRTR
jgi:hypothetical protein